MEEGDEIEQNTSRRKEGKWIENRRGEVEQITEENGEQMGKKGRANEGKPRKKYKKSIW